MPATGLLVAATIVAVAIVVGGPISRALNGVGATLWLVSGVFLAFSLPNVPRRGAGWFAAAACGLLLGAVLRPGESLAAIVGFGLAGLLVVMAAGDRSGGWALLVPVIYLPVHLLIGIGRALLRNGGLRTDPPPTAAIVPLLIVLAAAAGGALAATALRRAR